MDKYALGFSVSNLGPKSFQKLINKFDTTKNAWEGSAKEFEKAEIRGLTFEKFEKFRDGFDPSWYSEQLKKVKVDFVSFFDEKYPKSFRKLENPPIGIFVKGNISLLNSSLKIAVVGTRKITNYGKSVTEQIVSGLVNNCTCIVSGLALGVDSLAHKTCLVNNGLTIAVMPCGVDCCLPSENYSIYSQIIKNNGVVLSEYPLSQPPNKGTFLARNRLIAALSDGVLVTEAAEDSGSLVTADWGFKLNKKVFAIPGAINSQMAKGSLKLLKQGAILVTDGKDILQEFSNPKFQVPSKSKNKNLKISIEEKKIIDLLQNEEMTIDVISKKLKISISKLFISLSNLEILGLVKNNGGYFRLN